MKRILLSAGLLLAVGSLAAQAIEPGLIAPGTKVKDAATYATIPGDEADFVYKLENNWLYSVATANFPGGPGLGADARNITYANGKVYVGDRTSSNGGPAWLLIFDAETGEPIGERKEISSLFKVGEGWAPYPNNSIRTDAGGNLVFMNMALNLQVNPFQVWVMADENAEPKKILDFSFGDMGDAAMRLDFANVYGDLTSGDAYVIGAVSGDDATVATRIYRWDFKDGVFIPANDEGDPARIDLKKYFPATVKVNGTAPFIYPISKSQFFLDTNSNSPARYNMSGTLLESFDDAPAGTEAPQSSANGVADLTVNGQSFLITGSGPTSGAAVHNFFLYRLGEGSSFDGMEKIYTFPQTMGGVANLVRVVLPVVNQVDENKAEFYLYAPKNGLAKYTFSYGNFSGIGVEVAANAIKLEVNGNEIKATEEVKSLEVFAVTGQKVAAVNGSSVDAPASGVYIVKVVSLDGATSTQKVLVK